MNDQSYVTEETLQSIGIAYDPATLSSLIEHINSTIDERVGAEVTSLLNDNQLAELLNLQDNGTEEQVGEWIAQQIPDYQDIINDNIDITLGEIAENVDNLKAS